MLFTIRFLLPNSALVKLNGNKKGMGVTTFAHP